MNFTDPFTLIWSYKISIPPSKKSNVIEMKFFILELSVSI